MKSRTIQKKIREESTSTKERILNTARMLFNQQGVEAVTVRHIAQELGISHGNLCYHFPRKEDIIFTLYNQVVEGMSAEVAAWKPESITLSMVLYALHKSYELQYSHKFLMVDFVNIMRRIPEIKEHFREIFELRKQQFGFVLLLLKEQGVLRKDIPDIQYQYFSLHSYILGDFWMSESEILYSGKEEDKCRFYATLAGNLFYPYLTAKGRREFDKFYGALKE